MRLLALVLLTACGGAAGPRAVLVDYLAAEQLGRYDDAHDLLTASDRHARPLDAYVAEHLSAGPIWLAVAARTRFDVGTPQAMDDHVRVPVTAVHADLHAVQATLPPLPPGIEADPDPAGAVRDFVGAHVDRGGLPEVREQLTYALREEDGVWRVWLGLDRQDAAIAAAARARAAAKAGDTEAAAAAWREVLALPLDPSGVVAMFQQEAREALGTAATNADR